VACNPKIGGSSLPPVRIATYVMCALGALGSVMTNAAERRTLTLWMMPLQSIPADRSKLLGARKVSATLASTAAEEYAVDILDFNRAAQAYGIRVLNTEQNPFKQELLAQHPDFPAPTLEMIAAQGELLEAIGRIATKLNVELRVLFVSWQRAFGQLCEPPDAWAPNVAQVGSTWVEHFAAAGKLAESSGAAEVISAPHQPALSDGLSSETADGPLVWRLGGLDRRPVALKWSLDFRLLFYWRLRLPNRTGHESAEKPFELDASSWRSIADSLANRVGVSAGDADAPGYSFVFPCELDFDLLHNYLMLAEAEGGTFVRNSHALFDHEVALRVPCLLADTAEWNSGTRPRQHRLFSFPLMTIQEAISHFLSNEYIAILRPPDLLVRW